MGESGDKKELFEVDDCENSRVDCIASKVNVSVNVSLSGGCQLGAGVNVSVNISVRGGYQC